MSRQKWGVDRLPPMEVERGAIVNLALPPLEARDRDFYRGNFRAFCHDCLRITDKSGNLIPFDLNTTQEAIFCAIEHCWANGIPPRLIILKSRQVGVSTLLEALLFWRCLLWDNQNSLVLAHNMKSSKGLFRMARRYLQNLPDQWQQRRKLDNVHELHFAASDSRLQVETVGEVRGYTAQSVHLSELAFYAEQADETFRAIMQVVPRTPESLVGIESTANGVGNKFHEIWVNAVNAAEDSSLPEWERGWTPVFIPWFKHTEYSMQPWFTSDECSQAERHLAKAFGLNLRQLAWRRWCIKTNCDGDVDTFKQEYPATWREAFLLSGRPVFDTDGLGYYLSCVPPETPVETLPEPSEIEWDEKEKKALVYPVERGRFRVFDEPIDRHTYIIGVDPSEGDPKSDPSPFVVLDQMTLGFPATWHGRCPPDVLAEYAVAACRYYRNALLIWEANNHGIAFRDSVERLGYDNIYWRKVDEQSVSGEVAEKAGWMQTNRNKHSAINAFRKLVRDKVVEHKDDATRRIRCPILVGEMSTLIYKQSAGGSTLIESQPGHFKDTVMAASLAIIAHRGADENPLEPLPDEVVLSAAFHYAARRLTDPEGAEEEAVAMTGMTGDELERLSDLKEARRLRRDRLGLDSSR